MQDTRAKLTPSYHLANYLGAGVVGALIWYFRTSGSYDTDISPLTLATFGAGAVLAIGKVVESYLIAATRRGASGLDRCVYDVMFCIFIAIIVCLFGWTATDSF